MPLTRSSGQAPARRGAVTPLVALCLVGVVGVVAIAVDGGVLLAERRHAQSVADAAAMAAASDLCQNWTANQGSDPQGTAKASAVSTAQANGYATSTTDITTFTSAGGGIQVNIPPKSGAAAGKVGYVEVLVKYNESRSFSGTFGSGLLPVNARSVATGRVISKATAGILVLDPNAPKKGDPLFFGGISVGVMGAPVVVNSTISTPIVGQGGGNLSAPSFYTSGGSPGYSTSKGATLTGPVYTGNQPMADPLAGLPVPDPSAMTVQSTTKVGISGGTQTLSPGVYQGGISISSSSNVTLLPGIYYMEGGGFTISGQANVTGNGVMIYNAPQASTDVVKMTGQGSVNISPPTGGTYQGLSVFQDRTSGNTMTLAGGSSTNITGSFYAAGATLDVVGGSTASTGSAVLGSQYISKDLYINGHGSITINATSLTATTQRIYGLME